MRSYWRYVLISSLWLCCRAVWAQPPQPPAAVAPANPAVDVQWNQADMVASRIRDMSQASPETVAHNFLWMVQAAQWDEASLYVAGLPVPGTGAEAKAVALLKKLVPGFVDDSGWRLDLKDGGAPDAPRAAVADGEQTQLQVTLVAQDFLTVELRTQETLTFKREKLAWTKGLQHEAGAASIWRIVSPTSEPGAPQRKFGVLATYALMLSDARVASRFAGGGRSVKQAKQIGLAFAQFVQDWGEKIDMDENNWISKVTPYVKRPDTVFNAPGDLLTRSGYSLNPKLAGKMLSDVQEPAQTVLVYLGKDGKLDGRYDGLATVCFADGHVEMVAPDTKLRWEP